MDGGRGRARAARAAARPGRAPAGGRGGGGARGTSVVIASFIPSHLLLVSSSARSASATLAESLAPLFGSSIIFSTFDFIEASEKDDEPPGLGGDGGRCGALACATCHFCLSFVRASRSAVAFWYCARARSRFLSTSFSEAAIPELNASSDVSPETCSACTRCIMSSCSESSPLAMCVNGSESSVSDCESELTAGPRSARSAAASASVFTVERCAASAAETTLWYSDANARSFSTPSSSGTLVRKAAAARFIEVSVASSRSADQERRDEFFAVCSSHTFASRNVSRSAAVASCAWLATRRRKSSRPACRRWMNLAEKRSSLMSESGSGRGGTIAPGHASISRSRSHTKSR